MYLTDKIKRGKSFEYEVTLSYEMEKAIKIPVDVKILNFAPLPFQFCVLQGKLIYARDENIWEIS